MTTTEKQKLASKKWYLNHKEEIQVKRKGTRTEEGKRYYEKNKERIKEKQREWALNNPDKVKASLQRYRDSNRELRLLWNVRSRAIKRGLDFNLEKSDIIIPTLCPYLNVPLIYKDKNFTPSIDRIDNTQGYTKGNIEVISLLANKMKNIATKEQLIAFSKSILHRYKDYE